MVGRAKKTTLLLGVFGVKDLLRYPSCSRLIHSIDMGFVSKGRPSQRYHPTDKWESGNTNRSSV